jgi:hypothetical protein
LVLVEADMGAHFRDGKPIRREFGNGNRLHIYRHVHDGFATSVVVALEEQLKLRQS